MGDACIFWSCVSGEAQSIVDEFGEPDSADSQQQEPEPEVLSGPAKRDRISAPLHTTPVSNLPEAKLAQVVVQGLKKDLSGKVHVRIGQDQAWFLINSSDSAIKLPAGFVVAGFGAGTFKHVPRGAGNVVSPVPSGEKSVLFDLDSSASLVLHNNKLATLGDLVMAGQSASRAQPEICYHTREVTPEGFKLTRKHDVYYKCTGKVAGQQESSPGDSANLELKGTAGLAALMDPNQLKFEQGHCAIIWAVKWATKGLMPIKPHCVLLNGMEIPGNTAVKL